MEGHSAICDALLWGRADIDARSSQQDTALMWAAHLGLKLIDRDTLLDRGIHATIIHNHSI